MTAATAAAHVGESETPHQMSSGGIQTNIDMYTSTKKKEKRKRKAWKENSGGKSRRIVTQNDH